MIYGNINKFSPTHQQIQNILQNNRNILFELYLTEIIQHWFDFLLTVYEKACQSTLSGTANYPVPTAKIKVNLSSSGSTLIQTIVDTAVGDFDFLAAPEKLRIVKTILGSNLSGLSHEEGILRLNIQVRNILQHRGGIVSSKDLADLGVASITEDHGSAPKAIGAGQKVSRTGFDIENLVDALRKIAQSLIP